MKPTPPDPNASRLEEIEIKLAFMEKELEEYKEASRTFYKRLAEMEEEIRTLNREIPVSSLPSPEVTWAWFNQATSVVPPMTLPRSVGANQPKRNFSSDTSPVKSRLVPGVLAVVACSSCETEVFESARSLSAL